MKKAELNKKRSTYPVLNILPLPTIAETRKARNYLRKRKVQFEGLVDQQINRQKIAMKRVVELDALEPDTVLLQRTTRAKYKADTGTDMTCVSANHLKDLEVTPYAIQPRTVTLAVNDHVPLTINRAVCLDITLQTAAGPLELRSIEAFILEEEMKRLGIISRFGKSQQNC